MPFRNCSLWLSSVALLLLSMLLPLSRVSALVSMQQFDSLPTDPLPDETPAAYAIHPLLQSARGGGAQPHAAVNPARAWQLRFRPGQIEVGPASKREGAWRLTLGLAPADATVTAIDAAGRNQAVAVTLQGNRLRYQRATLV